MGNKNPPGATSASMGPVMLIGKYFDINSKTTSFNSIKSKTLQ